MLDSLPNSKGRIAAVQSGFRLILTGAAIQTISLFYDHTFSSLGLGMIMALMLMFFLVARLNRKETNMFLNTLSPAQETI